MSGSSTSCSCGAQASAQGTCPCQTFVYPETITNPPGRTSISYRVADFLTMRYALLLARLGEVELSNWRPGATGDLAVQMIEWWAYLGDILTFYNERIANESYLLTAMLPQSVQGLIRILGYRPRPGIGATGTLAAVMTGIKSFTLPQGFQIQSKPGPGEQPQIFELNSATQVQATAVVPVTAPPAGNLIGADGASVLIQGVVGSVKVGDQLLLMETGWSGTDNNWATVTVASVSPEKNPQGQTNTRITFTAAPANIPASAMANGYSLLRSAQSAYVWQYPADPGQVIRATQVDLESITRNIQVGSPILFSLPDIAPQQFQLVSVTQYTETIWYANANSSTPAQPPSASPAEIAIPIPHTGLQFTPALNSISDSQSERAKALVFYAWKSVGTIISTPATNFSTAPTITSVALNSPLPSAMHSMNGQDVLIGDSNGNGVEAEASYTSGPPAGLLLSNYSDSTVNLTPPLNVLFNLLAVTRGRTVTGEVLGSGDATIVTGQEFQLQKSPLTYLQNQNSTSGSGYSSTLKVWVNGVEWQEVPSFYGQSPNAQVFVTSEDTLNITHVQFGDGVNGSRLPSGANNVVANYRYGSGADAPDAGSLSVILQSWPGLNSILNPVQVGGGADPDPPQQIKTYAPQSVLTFGRAISASDYETIAAQAPGVARARAYFSWDSTRQRMMTKVYVGDNANAVSAADSALAGACDPNRPLSVNLATGVPIGITLTLVIDSKYVAANVVTAATAALIDPSAGLLGAHVIRIGQTIYSSQIYKACLSVAGAIAVHDLTVTGIPVSGSDFQLNPGEGGFLQLTSQTLTINPEVSANG
jgi:hypothetical protein